MNEEAVSSTESKAIEICHADFSYRNNHVLKDLNFTLPLGESIAILGANGSGKSTLLSILSGTLKCKGAQMLLDGEDLLKNHTLHRQLIGYIPQTDPLMPDMTVYDNLLLWYQGSRADFTLALKGSALQMLNLDDFLKKPVRNLSGGMRKRAALALAMINEPKILILDEPAAALDLCYKADVRDYLKKLHEAGHTLIMTTHDEEDLSIITRLYLLKEGSLSLSDPKLRGDELIRAIRR